MLARLVLPTVFLVVSLGCSSLPRVEYGLRGLIGKQLAVANEVLGEPLSSRKYGRFQIHMWLYSATGYQLDVAPSIGFLFSASSNSLITGSRIGVSQNTDNCEISLATDNENTIVSWGFSGNSTGCRVFGDRLDAFSKSTKLESFTTGEFSGGMKLSPVGHRVTPANEPIGLYATPSNDSVRIGVLYKSDSLTIAEEKDSWFKVETIGGQSGWVRSYFFKIY